MNVPEGRMQRGWSQALFSVDQNRTRSNGHKLKHKVFPLNRRNTFTVRVVEHRHRLPGEVVEVFKSHLDVVLGSGQPCLSREGRPDYLQRSFPTSTTQ